MVFDGLGFTHWLVALVATLLSQRLFPAVHEPTVPSLEVAAVVRRKRLLDVRHDKVIELENTNESAYVDPS